MLKNEVKKIVIEDYCDGFAIIIKSDDEGQRFHFEQDDDNREKLADIFQSLGFDVEYEEVY